MNAADSNLFLVIAQTETNDWQSEKKDSLTVFIVDGSLPGIKVQKRDKTIGISNLFQASVTFNDVILGNGKKEECANIVTLKFNFISFLLFFHTKMRCSQYQELDNIYNKKS